MDPTLQTQERGILTQDHSAEKYGSVMMRNETRSDPNGSKHPVVDSTITGMLN